MKKNKFFHEQTAKLWNKYSYVKKFDSYKYLSKGPNLVQLIDRKNKVLEYLEHLNLGKKISILELGYGAGQNATDFIKKSDRFYGIDISKPLAKFARKRNKVAVKKNKAKFLVGSMDNKFQLKSNTFDVIIIIGALQYVINPNYCFTECKRVLKKNGHLIIAQTNTFEINAMIHPRKFLINFSKFLIGEHYQYSHSDTLKSLFLETKLRKYFKKYKNSWWMNSWIFNYGWNDHWKFRTNRRLLSYGRLKDLIKKNNFLIKKSCSVTFFYDNRNIFTKIVLPVLDKILIILNKIFIFSFFLRYIGGTNIFLCKKN